MTEPSARKASAADVARAAGVSMQTVSRVARGLDNVQPATATRVREAMAELGYSPNRAARALRSGRFHTIGVIMFTLSSYGNAKFLEAIAEAASDAGYTITLLPVSHRTQGDVTGAFARLSEQAVDGIVIVIEADLLSESNVELPADLPVVIIDSSRQSERPFIDTDQALGARLATEHLLDLGHETVWHVAGPSGYYAARRREAAWRETLEAHGRVVPEPFRGDWSTESGYAAGREIARRADITAVFAGNDGMALGVLRAAHEAGRAVPASLSVVGFDDMTEAESFWPPLTTIRQSFDSVGRSAIALLLGEIAHAPRPEDVIVPTELVVRGSTAEAPGR
ncbi:substrate-binding domain-containing protein [Frondihabitans sp. PhB188]|uniref:LacI family DNA-binding transcriptional regulator n=1 Tax=Frondihabitans sp. PhB188 TaxID=2485200 RepID=UPI003519FD1E